MALTPKQGDNDAGWRAAGRGRSFFPVMRPGGRISRATVLLLAGVLPGLGAAGCARGRQVTQPAQRVAGVEHIVESGQTLWRIARTYGLPLEELVRVNRIADPDVLEVGTSLFIPGATALLEVPVHSEHGRGVPEFGWPVAQGRILSGFGDARASHRHTGLDIAGRHGQAILAAGAGRVVYSGSSMRGYGKAVIIDHGSDLRSLYAHGSELLVQAGQWVERGESIARIGRSGLASTEHCHFEIRRNDVPVDPLPYLRGVEEKVR